MLRTPLALVLGSLLAGCTTIGDTGGPGGDDDVGGAICGDRAVEGNETCDDGNTSSGDGCSASCQEEASPSLDLVVDKPAVSTELNTTTLVTATFVGGGGFSGPVTLAATVVDASGNPVPGWTVALNKSTVDVVDGAAVDAIATLTIPSENRGLAATVKIDATSSIGPKSVNIPITVANQITFEVTANGQGTCAYKAGSPRVTVGTKVRMLNKLADNVIFHSDGGARGVPHQDVGGGGTATNGVYETTITSAGNAFGWYCHSPGPNPNNGQITVGITPVAAQ